MLTLAEAPRHHQLSRSLLWPLNLFYENNGRQLPEITPLFGRHLPQPYRQLLFHTDNMTPTLESYHGGRIFIEPLTVLREESGVTREVILRTSRENLVVEYGASRIFLDRLPGDAVELIWAGREPLGRVLLQCHCEHTVEPSGFFKIRPTEFFFTVFGSAVAESLYGRRNRLVAPDGETLAEVCEILPTAIKLN